MTETTNTAGLLTPHRHMFLGADHAGAERRMGRVVALCAVTMVIEIVGGLVFGSLALVADGLHMSTHAGALLLAALAYRFARRHSDDPRFCFGTGKLGDLAGFTSAVVLGVMAAGIAVEAVARVLHPVPIHVGQALPIAALGLVVNAASAWLLAGGHSHGHHHHGHDHAGHDHHDHAHHDHGRDNNMRAAVVHVLADMAVSVLVIAGLGLACAFGWVWMDPLVSLVGAAVIASWAVTLIRDTGAILLDMAPDRDIERNIRQEVEGAGDQLTDLHVWRLGPGHLCAVLSVVTRHAHDPLFYRARLASLRTLSHVTVEVQRVA